MEPNQNQSSNFRLITALAIVILIIAGYFIYRSMRNTSPEVLPPAGNQSPLGLNENATSTNTTPKTYTVELTDKGYSPALLNIKQGDTITFVNNSNGRMWTASDPHPTHTDYPGFDERKASANGESYSFIFGTSGQWSYHNHINPSERGLIIVQNIYSKE